jgi:hypothetical protein
MPVHVWSYIVYSDACLQSTHQRLDTCRGQVTGRTVPCSLLIETSSIFRALLTFKTDRATCIIVPLTFSTQPIARPYEWREQGLVSNLMMCVGVGVGAQFGRRDGSSEKAGRVEVDSRCTECAAREGCYSLAGLKHCRPVEFEG